VARTFSYTQAYGCRKEGRNLKISAKKVIFLVSSGKKQISPLLGRPHRKTFGNIYQWPPWKNPSNAHAHKHAKLHHFCKKLCCISPSGNTVQQHQCGKQAIARWQTAHGVFCQTITKSCQITNNIGLLHMILSKYCQILQHFFIKTMYFNGPNTNCVT